jgi:drug/metabolite transporter (DMT)-like permease
MLEPVLAGIFAWIWLQQCLNGVQLLGAVVVWVGMYIADRARSAAI